MSTSNPLFEEVLRNLRSSVQNIDEIRIRAFRAIDEEESCIRYANGHRDVLKSFGLKLTSANDYWMSHPGVYVVLVEDPKDGKALGGARIEMAFPGYELPIVAAVADEAPEIRDFVNSRTDVRFGEICALWNSIAVAGLGIGSVYSIRSAIALAGLLDVDELIALCSPYTYRIASNYGFKLLEEVGNQGAIPYAGANEIAHVTYQKNVKVLTGASSEERNIIQRLRKSPEQTLVEHGKRKDLKVTYSLSIPDNKL